MTTINRTKLNLYSDKLPRSVKKQLAKIYSQSENQIKQHPYKTATGFALSLGVAYGAYLLIRYFTNK